MMDIEDKDYMRSTSAEYRAGYNHGRTDMMKEVVVIILLIGFLVAVFK